MTNSDLTNFRRLSVAYRRGRLLSLVRKTFTNRFTVDGMGNDLTMPFSSVQKVVNISTVKKLVFPIVVCLLIVDGIRYIDTGGQTCRRLLEGGSLIDTDFWQPAGCMLHHYKQKDLKTCLSLQRVAFVGDSRVRALFYSFVNAVSTDTKLEGKMHSDISFERDNINANFYWMPEANLSSINVYKKWIQEDSHPQVIIQSMATHTIKRTNGSDEGLEEYKTNITNLLPYMTELVEKKRTNIYWMLQEPVVYNALHEARRAITNAQLSLYNDVLLTLLYDNNGVPTYQGIMPMSSNMDVASQSDLSNTEDGLHLPWQVLTIVTDLIFNLICNDLMKPIDGSCCQKSPPITILQVTTFAVGVACILGFFASKLLYRGSRKPEVPVDPEKAPASPKSADETPQKRTKEILSAASRMFLILLYFYLCDRTDILMKANKRYTHIRFFVPLLYISLLGIFCIDQTKHVSLLNRDQTDEWKGWMQLIILIYHVTGASSNVPIYMHIRLLVAMYLFMTGYGHFSYFWNKGDFSLHRVYAVLFRLNFLTICLCVVMDRPYQFYYFVPLCSFWYLVLYFAMAMWPRAHVKPGPKAVKADGATELNEVVKNGMSLKSPFVVMSIKIAALFVGIVLLFLSQEIFESLFSWWPLLRLFELSAGSVREWWFRCQLDRFAMLHGAVFCFIYLLLKRLSAMDDTKQGCLFSTRASLFAVTISIGLIFSYTFWALHCTFKQACNLVHSYAAFLPISSFILIRNIPGYLRSGYSSFFAWFGKISLELFIGQYHIWLAADTKGVLVLTSPYWPSLNLLLSTVVFVCVAHEINSLTSVFVKYAVGGPRESPKTKTFRFLATLAVLTTLAMLNDMTRAPSGHSGTN